MRQQGSEIGQLNSNCREAIVVRMIEQCLFTLQVWDVYNKSFGRVGFSSP